MKTTPRLLLFIMVLLSLLQSPRLYATVNTAPWGVEVPRNVVAARSVQAFDSLMKAHPQLAHANVLMAVVHPRIMKDKTADFYILLFLCIALGGIRIMHPKYFQNLWRAFRHPTLSRGQLKDQMESASLSGLLMNIFFAMTMGAYVYYLVGMFSPQRSSLYPPSLLIVMLMGGMMLIYLTKYLVIRFSGWAFKVEGITEYYIFNVFLINKILGIVLLPFTILLAFADPGLQAPAVIVSFLVVGFLLLNRYTRSWQVLGSFFQYSKFHFFTYLCASELLPLAVLTKLLLR